MKPLIHIDRDWVRRGILIPLSFITIWCYIGAGIGHWWRDLRDVWHHQF